MMLLDVDGVKANAVRLACKEVSKHLEVRGRARAEDWKAYPSTVTEEGN